MTCARVQAEVAEDDEVEEDDSPPELIYAQAWGDSVTIATTNSRTRTSSLILPTRPTTAGCTRRCRRHVT